MDFKTFRNAVAKQFERMKKHDLLRTQAEKDEMWTTYLASFPAGSNPVYKERTEHDCNCCKQFIRAVGNVVAIIDGKMESIWDVNAGDPNYQAVTDALSALVKSKPIDNFFLHYEKVAGTDKNFQDTINGVKTWDHFFVNIPQSYVVCGTDIASTLGEFRALHDVLARSLTEITDESISTVQELIAQNSLYRGAEHSFVLASFEKLKKQYKKLKAADRDNFVWSQIKTLPASVSKIRNTVIGSLLVDLSADVEMESAVASFEAKVAPSNYKRPTALVTKAMIEKAKKAIEELGLTSALERRYAALDDITINNVLYANRDARKSMSADVFDDLAAGVSDKKPKSLDKVEEVSIEKFLADILPRAESIEVMVENRHNSNFMSLIAPVDPTARPLFKWPNNFSWSYNGDMADSIKERVKAAGGSVVGDLCCRLAWDYTDDLDFHMKEPNGGHIYFGNRRQKSMCGGMLDVDANGADGQREDPVENIFYADRKQMREGIYLLQVNNYSRRSDGKGFEVEIEFDGQVHRMGFEKVLRSGETIDVAKIKYSKAGGFEIIESLPSSQVTRTVWNVATQTFRKVNVVMLSPNHWDDFAVGNKHYFFMLDGCSNDGQARGFFNEFLKEELNPHRKVIEMVGSKLKTDTSDTQLSGLGFSSTQRNELLCRVKGSFSRLIKIVF